MSQEVARSGGTGVAQVEFMVGKSILNGLPENETLHHDFDFGIAAEQRLLVLEVEKSS